MFPRPIATKPIFARRRGFATMIATRREDLCGRTGSVEATGRGAVHWLGLAAAPTFAIMALLTGVLGGGAPDVLCSAAHDASPLSGMAPMYLLMTAFHSGPWLKLISGRRSGARAPDPGVGSAALGSRHVMSAGAQGVAARVRSGHLRGLSH
jgi:hypothetical protein